MTKLNLNKVTDKGVYIMNLEASRIYENMKRGTKLNIDFTGMIPYSLELIKLRDEQLKEYTFNKGEYKPVDEMDKRTVKNINKFYTFDVVSVNFNSKTNNYKTAIKKMQDSHSRKLEELKIDYIVDTNNYNTEKKKLQESFDKRIKEIETMYEDNTEAWETSLSIQELRNELYVNGFEIMLPTGEKVEYVVYKRSSSKSRVGSCLFIRKELYETMISWSRMNLDFSQAKEVDIPSLSAYESLVSSSINKTIKIEPKNILLVSDVYSTFEQEANVIETTVVDGKTILKAKQDTVTIENNIFDGEGLLDESYFNGEGFMLLRQHFFKSAVFNTNVVQFLKDYYGENYETATVKDYVGNNVKVKDIRMITTPSSIKIFKFSNLVGGDKAMYNHWKKLVKSEKGVFGVCKSESSTKLGKSEQGLPLQQMSYQMINSLPLSKEKVAELSKFEVDYINSIKNDSNSFAKHLMDNATLTNSNEMIANLYYTNPQIAKTKLFNDYKLQVTRDYTAHIKQGKIRVEGDYCVLLGNGYELLLHAVGALETDSVQSHSLKGNQVYTPMFKDGVELCGFRNPHTSLENVLYSVNSKLDVIGKYFNLTDNIVYINSIGHAIFDILSGADLDSDTALFTNNNILVEVARNNKSLVCINNVEATSNSYHLDNLNKAKVDDKIASNLIGMVVNTGALAQAIMYDAKVKGNKEVVEKMQEVVLIVNVLSTIAIDMAKKTYKIDAEKELERLSNIVKSYLKTKEVEVEVKKEDDVTTKKTTVKVFPQFLKGKNANRRHCSYHTAMDYLCDIFTVKQAETENEIRLQRANELKESDVVNMFDLVRRYDLETGEIFKVKNANDKQEKEIVEMVEKYSNKQSLLHKRISNANNNDKERYVSELAEDALIFESRIKKRAIKEVTIYALLYHIFEAKTINTNVVKIMNALYISEPNKFISLFQA